MVRRGEATHRSTWQRVAAWSFAALAFGALVGTSPAAAEPRRNLNRGIVVDIPGAEAVLYEVTEKMYLLDDKGNVVAPELAQFRKADASLFGWARVGNPLCPSLQLITDLRLGACSVTADGIDNISLWTGKGSVDGTFAVVVQDDNVSDAPEFVVMNGGFAGQMDLSIRPLGKIVGTFTSSGGAAPVSFCGMFRLPFEVDLTGKRQNPRRGNPHYYLADDGKTLIPVQAAEKSIGMPTVRLELKFGASCGS
jgi:hypothetical protein